MSEERLVGIETRLTSIETKVDGLDARFGAVDARFDAVDARFDAVDARFDDLGHQMRVLHEDTIDTIKALAPDFGPVRREFAEADTKLREEIDQRLVPLEAFARNRGRTSS